MSQREIVGREKELAAVSRFLSSDGDGATLLLLEGEAGIGKTTIWLGAIDLARGRSIRVLCSRTAEAEARLSFAAVGDLLGDALDEVLPQLEPARRQALEAALLVGDSDGVADERAVALALLDALRTLGGDTGVLVAIDDWQWLDAPSARALTFAARRLAGSATRLLCSVRIGVATEGLERALPGPELLRLRVQPFDSGEIHHLVTSRLGLSLSRPALLRLHEASGGNPFLALEIARGVADSGDEIPASGPFPVPTDLQALLRKRLEATDESLRDVLRIAALLASPSVSGVERIVGDPSLVTGALEDGVKRGLILVSDDRMRFDHPLLASAVLAGVSPGLRRELHDRIGRSTSDPEERTRHMALASEGPDERVAAALEEAAEHAAGRGAASSAAELAELAVEATEAHRCDDRVRRVLAAADRHHLAGDGPRAQHVLEELIETLPPGPIRADALDRLASVAVYPSEPLSEQALSEAGDDPGLRARIHITLSVTRGTRGDVTSYKYHLDKATELARVAGDQPLLAACLTEQAFIRGLQGDGPQRDLLEGVVNVPLPTGFADAGYMSGRLLIWVGELEEARALLEPSLVRAAAKGDVEAQTEALLSVIALELRSGDLQAADARSAEALELAQQMAISNSESKALYLRALVEAHLGQVSAAHEHAERGLAVSREIHDVGAELGAEWALGFTALSMGDHARAAELLGPLPERNLAIGNIEPGIHQLNAAAIEALIVVGELDRAAALLSWLEDFGASHDRTWALAAAARCRGLLLAATGDFNTALESCERALEHHEKISMPFELAHTLLVHGVIQRRAKLKRPARETLERAATIFEELGAPLWLERTRTELGRIGGRQPASDGALTATEQRVAELAAAGHSNKQIAAELFLSERTVEANLTKVYRKLGISSRTQLAAALVGEANGDSLGELVDRVREREPYRGPSSATVIREERSKR